MPCIKTGAVAYFPEYTISVPCDLYEVGEAIVIKFLPEHFFYDGTLRQATYVVAIGRDGFLDKRAGIAVIPKKQLGEFKC